ncbi:phosphocholine-specific phospholipase C [Hamadaea tsunoensis]|uniref:phosphocholine-specific phospholipase C n=1 Tax=Hamadaea tsunoensis TaxID=53368 RepID=UPI0003FACC63|nr:phospholipase C, phosphocholine-specific [Hamadaea tsunoensis]
MAPPLNRRQLLGAAGVTAGTAAAATLPAVVRDLLAASSTVEAGSGTIADVEHVVVFMQENRSFDHYFGTLKGVRGFGDPTAVAQTNGNSVFQQPSGTGTRLPWRMNTTTTSGACAADLDHSFSGLHTVWNAGKHDQWVNHMGAETMGYFTRADMGFYYALADAFTVCDNNFCSVMGPTNPNRLYLFSGTANGTTTNTVPSAGFTWTTYAERLQAAGITWKVYQENNNYDDNALAWFKNFRSAKAGQPLYDRGMVKQSDMVAAFGNDIAAGTLPQVSWIVAADFLSEHPAWPPAKGQDLCARLLAKLAANPAVWAKTVFILNYDENDGFFDHMPPPAAPNSTSQGQSTVSTTGEFSGTTPMGLGHRVPMVIVSPFSRGGFVCSELFDHTSVIRFLEKRFGVQEPNISAWRRAVCGDLTSALDFTTPNTAWPSLPDTSGYPAQSDTQCSTLPAPTAPATQSRPTQESGTRPARALPYTLTASGRVASDNFWIDFANTGTAGAHFYVYANKYRTDGPWRYTVEAGKTLSDYWQAGTPTGAYDLNVHSPNGFLRRFAGNRVTATTAGNANPEVTLRYSTAEGRVYLTMKNSGGAACTVTITANRYRTDGPWTYSVGAGATVEDYWTVTGANNWYDLTATANTTDGFVRRFAGHLETGAASTSDPSLGATTTTPGALPATVRYYDSQETQGENGAAVNAVDGSSSTIWHTQWYAATAALPHEIQLDLGASKTVTGLGYTPRQDGGANGRVGQYEIYLSADGSTWGTAVATGTFPDSAAAQQVTWTGRTARYVRLRALTEAGGRGQWTSAAEVTALGY